MVNASYELLEKLADPDLNLTAFVESSDRVGVLYAYEVCDACEIDEFGHKINGTLVSDFVYPARFESFRKRGSTQFDYQKRIKKPFEFLNGRCISIYAVITGGGWYQITAEHGRYRYVMRPDIGSGYRRPAISGLTARCELSLLEPTLLQTAVRRHGVVRQEF